MPAEFRWTGKNIIATISAGQQLAAEANTHDCPARIAKGFHQTRKLWKIGIEGIVECVLLSAQNDKGIMTARIFRKRFPRIGANDVYLRICLRQCHAELSMRRARHVFDNCDAHATS